MRERPAAPRGPNFLMPPDWTYQRARPRSAQESTGETPCALLSFSRSARCNKGVMMRCLASPQGGHLRDSVRLVQLAQVGQHRAQAPALAVRQVGQPRRTRRLRARPAGLIHFGMMAR